MVEIHDRDLGGLGGCLDGVRVLDLSQYLPGPYAGQLLSDLGASVVKLEPPAGDPMRAFGPRDDDGLSAFYKLVNAGKQVLVLDLKSGDGRTRFADLIGRADVLLESFRPGALDKLGFGADAVRAINPDLVHCALSGYGQTGPYAGKAGHDLNYMALSGGLSGSGTPERPVQAFPPTADFASGQQAALAILAALLRRERGGGGAFLDLGIAESVLGWQAVPMTQALRAPVEAARGEGVLNGGAACYQIYRTADRRFVTLAALEAKFWANFCHAVERDDWIARQWEALPQRDLIAALSDLFMTQPLAHWDALLDDVDCCYQAVLLPEEVPDHPQIVARGFVQQLGGQQLGGQQHGGSQARVGVSYPLRLDGKSMAPRSELRDVTVDEVVAAWA